MGQPASSRETWTRFRTCSAPEPRGASLDDRTWNDLLLDDVFAQLDRTESSVGQQVLYSRLRSAPSAEILDGFDALIASVAGDGTDANAHRRAGPAAVSAAYYLHRLAGPDALAARWHVVFPIWTGVALLTMSLAYFRPARARWGGHASS